MPVDGLGGLDRRLPGARRASAAGLIGAHLRAGAPLGLGGIGDEWRSDTASRPSSLPFLSRGIGGEGGGREGDRDQRERALGGQGPIGHKVIVSAKRSVTP